MSHALDRMWHTRFYWIAQCACGWQSPLIEHEWGAKLAHTRHAEREAHAVAKQEMEAALKQVEEATDPHWAEEALDALRRVCEQLVEFISDDVWEAGGLRGTREDRALGPVFLKAKKLGWCEKTGRVRPSVRSHLSGKPVWRSLIYVGPQ